MNRKPPSRRGQRTAPTLPHVDTSSRPSPDRRQLTIWHRLHPLSLELGIELSPHRDEIRALELELGKRGDA